MCINCERPALACLFDKAPLVQADAEKLLQVRRSPATPR